MSTLAPARIDPGDFAARRAAIAALDAEVRAIDGHDALGDAVWRDLAAPGAESAGFLVDGSAYLHLARADGAGAGRHWAAGIVRLPVARDRATTARLLDAAVAHVAAHGGGHVECWVFGSIASDDDDFTASGFARARELFEMRVALPLNEVPAWPAGVRVRSFEPGADDDEWVDVNNRAFTDHPDQGNWTAATLRARMREPWFDPSLFLVAVDDHGIAGFNWLKVHAPRTPDPELGEIYVIGVDPRGQGTGLGRALAVAGLQAVEARGVGTGMLFCAADNTGALALYRALGFEVHRTDRAYAREVTG